MPNHAPVQTVLIEDIGPLNAKLSESTSKWQGSPQNDLEARNVNLLGEWLEGHREQALVDSQKARPIGFHGHVWMPLSRVGAYRTESEEKAIAAFLLMAAGG